MRKDQIDKIVELRKTGIGYRSIAAAMGLSRDVVRYHCKVMGIDGFGDEVKSRQEEFVSKEFCKNCKMSINNNHIAGRRKTYCSASCKKKWELERPLKKWLKISQTRTKEREECKLC
ncbi:hypothetical protein [Proteiniclasticum ruminis]|uniref:hypothetical protein n=1 Tax=Proteiniclasticum ruminis TaxID=398199 RepID=UPI00289CE9F0|nr:hypothetical protein [Proteiniclasticum ruminis]